MKTATGRLFEGLMNCLFPGQSPQTPGSVPDLVEDALQAMRDWQCAENRFDFVSDPELVDQTIFSIEACKKRYTYLLGRLRRLGEHGTAY